MSFEVGVVAHFSAHHHLVGNFGPASQPHEHAYRVEVGVSGTSLQQDGTLFDISRLQDALNAAIGDCAGRDLNGMAELAEPNPSAEVVARYFFERIAPAVSGANLGQLRVRVWESPEAYAAFTGHP
ncbi:MAG: 6-pyruvoyl trahydropterin synthase family protein [Chloroflexota bacterium]